MEIRGFIEGVNPIKKVSETFQVREFLLKVPNLRDPKYDDYIVFQLSNGNCGAVDNMGKGMDVVVTFDLRGRKWTGQDGIVKYITTLSAWKVLPYVAQAEIQQPAPAPQPTAQPAPATPYASMVQQNPTVEQLSKEFSATPENDFPF